ncbi:unnamed protein product [Bursaphelenchus okinawaensis]|uniref:Dynamin N-terminal domain-containing protein n=1 Tax=Bursaphelenchus okinawaensis TaxID=465554 RepID=A0A811KJP6_9BILA|nr:unnamed protein product [Bursaphelenchus okinawaensis]CAG9106166.1 unnamed protein product [Bursaphelenchus okinawaensis]
MCKRKPKEKPIPELTSQNIHEVLPLLYEAKVVPVEKRHIYDVFYTPKIEATEFKATPIIMFLGQYSVGKTSMIKYFVGSEYPGSMIGPEPTTDCFTAIFYSDNPHEEMGPSLIANPTLPFGALQKFGGAFENRLRGAAVDSKILKHMTFIDTPGILAGDKQVKSRN